jgi:hypothetical protein
MNYHFKGNLKGFYCGDCYDFLYNAKVKIYAVDSTANVTALAVAKEKETFHQRTDEELKSISKRLIAEAVTDEAGNFVVELSEKNYNGGAFDIDFECGTVPIRIKIPPKPRGPFQFHITTLQPQWRQQENGMLAVYDHAIAASFFCRLLSLFDTWVVCGTITDCETKKPVPGVNVYAYDVDWLQDDELGFGTTDANGKFTIVYPGDNFRQTLLSPWLNIEWPSGPDYYFKIVEPISNIVLLKEDRSVGHRSDRENRGNCFCVNLCVDAKNVPSGNYFPALFERVGSYDIVTNFTATGFTNDAQNNAFTGQVALNGQLPSGTNSNAMQYRFRIINSDTSYELTPAQVKAALPAFKIGELLKNLGGGSYAHPDLNINPIIDADVNGWITVPRQNDLSVGGVGIFSPNGGALAALNTAAIALDATNTRFAKDDFDLTVPAPAFKAGSAVPATKKAAVHTFKIIFEARDAVTLAIHNTNQLTKIVLCNVTYKQRRHPSWGYVGVIPNGDASLSAVGMLEINETTAVDAGCGTIVDTVTANYTCCHPHMESMHIYIEGNVPVPPPISSIIQNVSGVDDVHGEDPTGQIFVTTGYPKCAFIVWLKLTLRLTSGAGRVSGSYIEDHIAFCKS